MLKMAYEEIDKQETLNTAGQGVSGFFGFPWNLLVDAASVPAIYMPMFMNIRNIFGRGYFETYKVKSLIIQIAPEILVDLLLDKGLGSIPVAGIYFNAICAKNMTWRLGILFTMISASGDEISTSKISQAMTVIRMTFPQEGLWRFKRPEFREFERLCEKFMNLSAYEFNARVERELRSLKRF
ncbi:MAG: hypothetical protein LBT59_04445 [Clostridiales bacterium]|jgi:hypothetical protein|nr:hypothetical protein [Clostridiales bacterium]